MAKAMTRLHALVVNDPSHPAVLEFMGRLSAVIATNTALGKGRSVKTDVATLICIEIMVEELEQRLMMG